MKLFLFITMFFIGYTSFGQQSNPSPARTKQDYLKKSKAQKTTALILTGGGLVMTTAALSIVVVEGIETTSDLFVNIIAGTQVNPDPTDDNSSITGALFFFGSASMIAGISLFISASKNKRKAMSISFNNQSLPQIQNNNFVYRAIPSLKLKISL
jgi:hypothetical protein